MQPRLGRGWTWQAKQGIKYLTIDAFELSGLVRHGFSTRKGGSSKGDYTSLNMGLHVGDKKEDVWENRQRFAQVLAVPGRRMVLPAQIHGNQARVVTGQQAGAGVQDLGQALTGVDALVTQDTHLPLCTVYADCVPVFILDPQQAAIGLAHAGRKGTAGKIAAQTLRLMADSFGTQARDCLIGLGPAIGPCCYTVDQAFWQQFTVSFSANEKDKISRVEKGRDTFYLNLWEANRLTLLAAGVPAANIWCAEICTRCQEKWFYSYRAAKGRATGRMAAILALKD